MSRLTELPAVLMAVRNLRRNRLRSVLAALGIVIGVLAIATLGIFGNVLQLAALDQLGGIGNQVIISPNQDAGAESLSARDVAEIERIAEGRGTAVPLFSDGAPVSGPGDTDSFANVYGTNTPAALFTAESGTVPERHRQGALVGTELADELGVQAGSVIEISGTTYRVIGILAEGEDISPVQPGSAVSCRSRSSPPATTTRWSSRPTPARTRAPSRTTSGTGSTPARTASPCWSCRASSTRSTSSSTC